VTKALPPHSIDAELAVLGSVLVDASVLEEVQGLLRPEDFYRESHQTTYRAMLAVAERDEPVDVVTVSLELERVGDLELVGGPGEGKPVRDPRG
jgi:replicative DNA helicase